MSRFGRALLALTLTLCFLSGCSASVQPQYSTLPGNRLHEMDVAGAAYSHQALVFFGESTTAHLSRVGGVLDTPSGRCAVWRDDSGTRMLDRRILASPVLLYASNGTTESVSVTEALERVKPEVLVLSFGLNGILRFTEMPEQFLGAYQILIDGVRKHSPDTRIILQSVYPVRASTGFSVDVKTLSAHICTLNQKIAQLAYKNGVRYADTASLLCDADGLLRAEYDSGDGIHLTNQAYRVILAYFQTDAERSASASISKGCFL